MGLISIDGNVLRKMIICGANELTRNSRTVDALNVFPVPDGDTGTNMSHTVQAAAQEVYKLNTPNIYDVAKAASNGALRGARGNSGVILSQLFRGFAKGLEGKALANGDDLADALSQSAETAYKAVMKPKEGTILTIARAIGEQAYESVYDADDINSGLRMIIEQANETLARTPSMLPELQQAGVVDSGGLGLIYIFKGALESLSLTETPEPVTQPPAAAVGMTAGLGDSAEIRFVYCTEFLIDLPAPTPEAEAVMKNFLPHIGDSAVVVTDERIVKIHVHTNHPGQVLEKALTLGALSNIKIENMREQHTSMLAFSASSKPPKPVGFVAVAAGLGLRELLSGLGADVVIEGGQSMNPSAEDIAKAIDEVNASCVIILPNNKNIILTAQQAAELTAKDVRVVPTRSIPQGVSCLISFVDAGNVDESLNLMQEAMGRVHSGQITRAVRNTVMDGKDIREGDFLGLYDNGIVLTRNSLAEAAEALCRHMLDRGGDVVSLYYGEGVTEETAQNLASYVTDTYPGSEVEVYNGKQPLYSYIISVE